MKIPYPFYDRIFALVSKMRTTPWFKGQSKTASAFNAAYIVVFHQLLLANFFFETVSRVNGLGPHFFDTLYLFVAVFIALFNIFYAYNFNVKDLQIGVFEICVLVIFILTFLLFLLAFLKPNVVYNSLIA